MSLWSTPRSGIVVSYFAIIIRNFHKKRLYTLLNLVGLALGYTAFVYTLLYVHFETHFEDIHKKSSQIYRVTHQFNSGDGYKVHWARVPHDYINELPNHFPGIKTLIRFQNHERKYVRVGQEKFRPDHAYVTDKEVFKVFDFKLISGNLETALAEPHSIVITKSLAEKYFGDVDPLNKEIFVIGDLDQNESLHHVTGVMEDVPLNTHLPIDMLISFKSKAERAGWAYTYVLLNDDANADEINRQIPSFVEKHETSDEAKKVTFLLQPIQDIHLNSNLAREIVPNSSMFYVRLVAFGGVFIILIAVINFMNLNSAMALSRAKEIAMRKVMGATKGQITAYLFMESITYHLIALAIAGVLAYFLFPLLQDLVPIAILINTSELALILVAIASICGFVSGLYPVLLLVSLRPMDTMRSNKAFSFARREGAFSLKRVMVTLQFCISIIFGGSAIVAYHQFRLLNEKNIGISSEQVIAIPGVPDKVKDDFIPFKNSLAALPGIVNVAACLEVPSREIRDAGPVLVEGVNNDQVNAPLFDIQIIDPDFIGLLGIELAAGENIPRRLETGVIPKLDESNTIQRYLAGQERAYLINETAMRRLGWKEPSEAIGQRINWSIGDLALAYGPIAGVVRDFHQETLKNRVDPIVMVYEPVWIRTFLIKVETKNIQTSIGKIQSTWDKMFPQYPMEYFFLDELYENLYKGERVQLQLLYIFSVLSIVIAFIGLIGLITYALRTRVREIAIRQVMGASIRDLIQLISREYLMVLLFGSVLAVPVSIFGLRQWLSTFAYRVDISPMSYVLTCSLMGLLLIVTIGWQTFRSSAANPSEVLRNE